MSYIVVWIIILAILIIAIALGMRMRRRNQYVIEEVHATADEYHDY